MTDFVTTPDGPYLPTTLAAHTPSGTADDPQLSDVQLRGVSAFVQRHPGCSLQIKDCGGGSLTISIRDGKRGRLLFQRHLFRPNAPSVPERPSGAVAGGPNVRDKTRRPGVERR